MPRPTRSGKRPDYRHIADPYTDRQLSQPMKRTRARKVHDPIPGRPLASPNSKKWPIVDKKGGIIQHHSVEYYEDVDDDLSWGVNTARFAYLPLRKLDPTISSIQGLRQRFPRRATGQAEAHFAKATEMMLQAKKNQVITEAVGEIAAAICMMQEVDWEMIWGLGVHGGTGIDQIWKKVKGGVNHYMIVEAKGPGASPGSSVFRPQGFDQMEAGWVFNHLRRMSNSKNNGVGSQITQDLGLDYEVKHKNFQGSSTSYWSVRSSCLNAVGKGRLRGRVLQAHWTSNGRLSCTEVSRQTYI